MKINRYKKVFLSQLKWQFVKTIVEGELIETLPPNNITTKRSHVFSVNGKKNIYYTNFWYDGEFYYKDVLMKPKITSTNRPLTDYEIAILSHKARLFSFKTELVNGLIALGAGDEITTCYLPYGLLHLDIDCFTNKHVIKV